MMLREQIFRAGQGLPGEARPSDRRTIVSRHDRGDRNASRRPRIVAMLRSTGRVFGDKVGAMPSFLVRLARRPAGMAMTAFQSCGGR